MLNSHMGYSLCKLLKGELYRGLYGGVGIKGDTRSLDFRSYTSPEPVQELRLPKIKYSTIECVDLRVVVVL